MPVPSILRRTAYSGFTASMHKRVRFVEAAGEHITPIWHPYFSREAVRYREVLHSRGILGDAVICTREAFEDWLVGHVAKVDLEWTEWAADRLPEARAA